MRRIATGILTFVFVAGSAAVARADSIFGFEDLALGTSTATPILETNNGVTASFTTSIPGYFIVDTNPDGIGTGQRLIQDENLLSNNVQLLVSFGGQQFQSVNLPFAILGVTSDSPAPQLTLQALLNGTAVGSISAPTTTNLPAGAPFYSWGALSFSPGTAFDSLVLTSNVNGFAIDDLSVSTSAVSGVPEPASIALLMFGMAGTLMFVRRRRLLS